MLSSVRRKIVANKALFFIGTITLLLVIIHYNLRNSIDFTRGSSLYNRFKSDATATGFFRKPTGSSPLQKFTGNFTSEDVVSPVEITQKTFLILKTGMDVLHSRIPSHLESTLKWFPHHAVHADGAATINGVEIIDIFSFLPEASIFGPKMEGYAKRAEANFYQWGWGYNTIKVQGENAGWILDRMKNIPGYAHAFVNNPDFDWYVMIDGDTMMFPSIVSAATAGMDPDDEHFIGKDVGGYRFAHGGSGLILSRGALRKMYGDSEVTAYQVLVDNMHYAQNDCCGDKALYKMFESAMNDSRKDLEYNHPHGYFQGEKSTDQKCTFESWCKPLGSFHHLANWEVQMLAKWYDKKLDEHMDARYIPTYFDYYLDFVMPHVAEEIPHWHMRSVGNENFNGDQPECKSKEACKKACADRQNCYAWSFHHSGDCEIFKDGISAGKAVNDFSGEYDEELKDCVSGFMVGRIKHARRAQFCDPASQDPEYEYQEGWLLKAKFDFRKEFKRKALKTVKSRDL